VVPNHPVRIGKNLAEEPFFQHSLRTRTEVHEDKSGLAKRVRPHDASINFEPQPRIRQFQVQMNQLIERKPGEHL